MKRLIKTIQSLSLARDLPSIVEIVRTSAKELTGADGATFILRENDCCYYVEENAIGPLWRGGRFPMDSCISGWAMKNRQSVVIPDIYADDRIPRDLYRPTFVKSLLMVPVRTEAPIAAIGNYWANQHHATADEIELLQALADSTSIAMENVKHLTDLKNQLERRDEFISLAAHELRTPITPLMLEHQLLENLLKQGEFDHTPRSKDVKRIIEMSRKQVKALSIQVENLLEASRLQLGKPEFYLEPNVDLSAVVKKALSSVKSQGSGFHESLGEGVRGRWDSARLELVARNLISNALKFGGFKPIAVTTARKGDRASLVVEDQGSGVAPSDQERIFGRFERARAQENYGGLGLGLYISREIVRGMGGEILVESAPGAPTRFIVSLPLTA